MDTRSRNSPGKGLLIVLGGGGHTAELLPLARSLPGKHEFVISEEDRLSEGKIRILKPDAKVFRAKELRRMKDLGILSILRNSWPSFVRAFRILGRSRTDCILTSGPGLALPFIILGKVMFRKKIIFIETISRVNGRSATGKIAYPFSDRFFVQWPEMKKHYPKSVFAGRLL